MGRTNINESIAATDLLEQLPITTDATTSRVVVNNALMRVVYFSFDTDQLLSTHSSSRAVVVTLIDGSMDFTVKDTCHHLSAGDCIYLCPGEEHSLVATSPAHMALTLVDVNACTNVEGAALTNAAVKDESIKGAAVTDESIKGAGTQDRAKKDQSAKDKLAKDTAHGQRKGPEEQRMQGHWLLAAMGKKVLRPGGRELTQDILSQLSINYDTDIIEFGPGLGHTAAQLLEKNPHSYIAVDRDSEGTHAVMELFSHYGQASYVSADAKDSGLPDESADLVIAEAMLTMQPDKGKRRIISEAARMLRPGGTYAIHELAFVPDTCPKQLQDNVAAQLRKTIKVGARPLTVADWAALLEEHGFKVTYRATRPMALLEPRRIISDEGALGAARFIKNVATNPAARKRILAMRKTFQANKENMAGVALIAQKQ